MKYHKFDNNRIEIIPEEMSVKDLLLTIARKSYETATPRGMGFNQPYLHSAENAPDFNDFLQIENEKPVMLLMDYINGRDCRTKVFQGNDGKLYLDSYAFQQRKVTSQEFNQGIIRDPADKFLDKVIEEIERQRDN